MLTYMVHAYQGEYGTGIYLCLQFMLNNNWKV